MAFLQHLLEPGNLAHHQALACESEARSLQFAFGILHHRNYLWTSSFAYRAGYPQANGGALHQVRWEGITAKSGEDGDDTSARGPCFRVGIIAEYPDVGIDK